MMKLLELEIKPNLSDGQEMLSLVSEMKQKQEKKVK